MIAAFPFSPRTRKKRNTPALRDYPAGLQEKVKWACRGPFIRFLCGLPEFKSSDVTNFCITPVAGPHHRFFFRIKRRAALGVISPSYSFFRRPESTQKEKKEITVINPHYCTCFDEVSIATGIGTISGLSFRFPYSIRGNETSSPGEKENTRTSVHFSRLVRDRREEPIVIEPRGES